MSLFHKDLVSLFPGMADTGGFAIGNGNGMDGVSVLMVEDKNVVVATAGRYWETTGLVGVGLQMMLVVKEYDGNFMRTGRKLWGNVGFVVIDDDGFEGRRSRGSRGAKIFCFLILVAKCRGKRFLKMLGDQLGS
jgi:hypothetical protein